MGVTRLSLGRRELQAGDSPVQRPGAPRRGNLPGVRLGPRTRLPADQHRPDRRHGRRGLGQLEDVRRARRSSSAPDCVTIYQMELPYNTVFSKELKVIGNDEPALAVADWPTKRAWVEYAFDEFAEGRVRGLQRLHGGEGQGQDAVRLPRGAVARGRHVRHRRRVVRARQRRPHPERRHVGSSTSRSSNAANCRSAGRSRPPSATGSSARWSCCSRPATSTSAYFRDKYGVGHPRRVPRRRSTSCRAKAG